MLLPDYGSILTGVNFTGKRHLLPFFSNRNQLFPMPLHKRPILSSQSTSLGDQKLPLAQPEADAFNGRRGAEGGQFLRAARLLACRLRIAVPRVRAARGERKV